MQKKFKPRSVSRHHLKKVLLIFVVISALVVAGWFGYKQLTKPKPYKYDKDFVSFNNAFSSGDTATSLAAMKDVANKQKDAATRYVYWQRIKDYCIGKQDYSCALEALAEAQKTGKGQPVQLLVEKARIQTLQGDFTAAAATLSEAQDLAQTQLAQASDATRASLQAQLDDVKNLQTQVQTKQVIGQPSDADKKGGTL